MTAIEGAKAPDFSLPASGDQKIQLSGLNGKNVVLYFYPRDDTPGCTTEAKDFTALKPEFDALDTMIIGVSADTVAKHEKFINKHDLKVTLVSDESTDMINDYGVWVEKNMYGRKYMGIERATFLIDKSGNIAKIWRKVKVKNHAQAVLDTVREL